MFPDLNLNVKFSMNNGMRCQKLDIVGLQLFLDQL